MKPTLSAALLTLLAFVLPACGGSSDPHSLTEEGRKALSSGSYDEAAKSFEKALSALGNDTNSPDWKPAKLGLIHALTRIDAARAKKDFLDYAAASPSKVTDTDFNTIASRLGDAGKLTEAIDVLKVGKEKFPESPHLDALGNSLLEKAQTSGDMGAADTLKGLGYVGD